MYSLSSLKDRSTIACEADRIGTSNSVIIGIIIDPLLEMSSAGGNSGVFITISIGSSSAPVISKQTPPNDTKSTAVSSLDRPFFNKKNEKTAVRSGPRLDTKDT